MKKPLNLTRSAASLHLIPLIHLILLGVSGGLAYLLEHPNRPRRVLRVRGRPRHAPVLHLSL